MIFTRKSEDDDWEGTVELLGKQHALSIRASYEQDELDAIASRTKQFLDENWQRLIGEYLRLLPQKLREREGRVLPGVEQLLEQLQVDGAAVGLLTGNTRAGADIKLSHFSLHTLVNSTCFGGYGDTRDDRNLLAADAIHSARAHVGRHVDADEVWIIGDTPRDVQCARSVGARAVAVSTGGYSCEQLAAANPDLLLETLEHWH